MLPISEKKSKRGFSIIELIIALAITSIALVAIYNLFISQQRSFRIQEEVANMQQNNRVAMENLAQIVKMAGSGVQPPQQKILYCGPFDFVFSGDFNGVNADAMSTGEIVGQNYYVAPDPTTFTNNNCETYRWTLDDNDDGTVDANDHSNTAGGAEQYSLLRTVYTLATSVKDEVAPNVKITDLSGNPMVVFQYWGYFDDDADLDLWGDLAPFNGELSIAEINNLINTLGPVTDISTAGGRALDDMLQMVDIGVINETHRRDPNYPSNSGFRQITNGSMVTPRNLWACSTIEAVAGYTNTLEAPGDNTSAYGHLYFKVTESGVPVSGAVVNFTATVNAIDESANLSTSPPPHTLTTDANGLVEVDFSLPACAYNPGDTITITATHPSVVTPFGPCAADSDTMTITVVAGPPSQLLTIGGPTVGVLLTCGETATVSTLDIEIKDMCGNLVPPLSPVTFSSFATIGGSCTGNSGFGTVSASWDPTGTQATISYSSPVSGPYAADRMATNSDHFAARIAHDFPVPGVFDCANPLAILELETFPETITNLDTVNNAITTNVHTDCGGAPTSDATFNIEDGCGNMVYDMSQLGLTPGASVDVAMTPDAGGQNVLPNDQGSIDAATPQNASITSGTAGLYTITYTDPSCSLPPLYTKILQPMFAVTAVNFRAPVVPISFQINDLHSCKDCNITTTNPVFIDCVGPNINTDITFIQVSTCSVAALNYPVELEVISSAGAAANATFDPTGAPMDRIMTNFVNGNISIPIYQGAAPGGTTLSFKAYSPSKFAYSSDPAGFICEAPNLVTVQSDCQYIKTYNGTILGGSVENTMVYANENLYIEVDDCNQNKNSTVKETITVTVTSPQGYDPATPDIETVILTETDIDTGIFNSNSPSGISPGPLPIIFCGLGATGDTSQNGRLFVRPGFDISAQYVDPDDPLDNLCIKYLGVSTYSCPAFIYSYFAQTYIHLDRHGVTANLSLGGNIFTNGEFELSGDMFVDCSGDDGIIGTADDYAITSLGHASIGGTVNGTLFAPSIDLYGPDGDGQNTQVFPPNEGKVTGVMVLMNGYSYDDITGIYTPEVVGSRTKAPSYGSYTSLAASAVYSSAAAGRPPGSSVITHDLTAPQFHNPPPQYGPGFAGTHVEYFNTDPLTGMPYDPNFNPTYALPFNQGGRTMIAKDLPTFDYTLSVQFAQDMTTRYHNAVTGVGEDTFFNSEAEFVTFYETPRTYTALDGTTYTSPHVNAQGKTIYIVGDPYEGTVFHFPNGFETANMSLGTTKQLIIHGMVVSETLLELKDSSYGGFAIYGCGDRPVNWIEGWTGGIFLDYVDWIAVRGGEEPIPYDMVAMVAKTKLSVRGTAHSVFKGIAYSESESHFHDKGSDLGEGKSFLHGAQIADIIHNCRFMSFEYNDCVRRAAVSWYGCYCDSGGAAVACQLQLTPSGASVTKGGVGTVQLNASAGIPPAPVYTYSITAGSTSGGTVDASGLYTSGPNVGVDIVQVTSPGCMPAQATITVINACSVTLNATNLTIPLGGAYVFTASSPQGGPYNWSFTQNQSGGILSGAIGAAITYTAGPAGGTDIIQVTDDGGCATETASITVDPCTVTVEMYEYNGVACTANMVDNVDASGEVCVSAILGDPASAGFTWFTSDPLGTFYDPVSGTWVASGLRESLLGEMVRYKAGPNLGTYSITAFDDEGCPGSHMVSTCDIDIYPTLAPPPAVGMTIYETETIELTAYLGPAVPPRTIVSDSVNDGTTEGTLIAQTPTTANYTPTIQGVSRTAEITILDNVGCSASTTLRIMPCPVISISPPAATTLNVGDTQPYSALPADTYTWALDPPTTLIASIDPVAGIVKALKPGTVDLVATNAAGCEGRQTLTINCPVLDLQPAASNVIVGNPDITYTITFGTAPYVWSSDAPSVADIITTAGNQAVVRIYTAGTATITVTDANGCSDTALLEVTCPANVTISVDGASPATPPLEIGETVRLVAAGGTSPYTWAAADLAPALNVLGAATVINATTVEFTANSAGSSVVTATDASLCNGTLTVVVNAAPCAETINVSQFKVVCNKRQLDIRATSDTQPDALPLVFAIFDPVGVQVWPAAGTTTMSWNGDKSRYEYKVSDLGGLDAIPWTTSYEIRVYSQDCPSAAAGTRNSELKNCP